MMKNTMIMMFEMWLTHHSDILQTVLVKTLDQRKCTGNGRYSEETMQRKYSTLYPPRNKDKIHNKKWNTESHSV